MITIFSIKNKNEIMNNLVKDGISICNKMGCNKTIRFRDLKLFPGPSAAFWLACLRVEVNIHQDPWPV